MSHPGNDGLIDLLWETGDKGREMGRKEMLTRVLEEMNWNYLEGGDIDTLTERINRLAKEELNEPQFTRRPLYVDKNLINKNF